MTQPHNCYLCPAPPPSAGPARYTLRAYQPHFSRPCLVAGPEHSRLVVRQYEGKRQQGDALTEAAFGPAAASSLLNGDSQPAASGERDGGCHAAVSPRADTPLVCCLLAIYRGLLGNALKPRR